MLLSSKNPPGFAQQNSLVIHCLERLAALDDVSDFDAISGFLSPSTRSCTACNFLSIRLSRIGLQMFLACFITNEEDIRFDRL